MAIAAGADERPSVKIDLLDHKVLRRELEAETLQAVQEYGLTVSYVEDNVQLLLSTLMVVCGAAAHLLPGKFNSHREELKICVVVYYVLVAITFLFSWAVTKDNFLVLCASETHKTPRACVSLKLQRFASNFTLKLSSKDRTYVSPSMSVESFFHEDGFVARPQYHKWVHKQIRAFPSSKLTSKKTM